MGASQPAYRAGPVGETVFISCSYGETPARLPRQKFDTCQKRDTCPLFREAAHETRADFAIQ